MAPAQMMERLTSLEEKYESVCEENAALRAQLEWFKRNLFGTGKSEKTDALQTRLGIDEDDAIPEPESKTKITYERSAKKSSRELPAERFGHLPVAKTVEIVPEAVKAEPNLYERIGQEETFEVGITTPKLWKRAIIRPKFRHILDRSRPPLIAPAPKRPVDGGYASAGLLAYVTLSKYRDHLPLYRQEKMSEHWGAKLSRKTMADWIGIVSEWFEPVYGRMRQNLLESGYLQADETPVRFMDPDQKKGKTAQGYLWVIGKPGSDVVFDWKLNRGHDNATHLLDGFEGILQSDGYEAYERFAQSNPNVHRVACWAHARRKFVEAERESPQAVRMVLRLIGYLYHMEKQWDQRGWTGRELRSSLRCGHLTQTLALLQKVAIVLKQRARPKSGLGKACGYLLSQWSPLISHCLLGETRLDNNLIENAIRPSAVGKKNYLFIGSPEAGKRTAVIYSIIVSCQRHRVDPLAYMTDLLQRLPTMSNQCDLDPLLPANWKPER